MAGERAATDAIMALTFATSSSRHLDGLGGTQSWQGTDSAALEAAVLLFRACFGRHSRVDQAEHARPREFILLDMQSSLP